MNMKTLRTSIVMFVFIASLALGALPAQAAHPFAQPAQEGTPSVGEQPTDLSQPAQAESPQPPEGPAYRPMLVLEGYSMDPEQIKLGANFDLKLRLHNSGHEDADPTKAAFAFNVVVTFGTGSIVPVNSGGVAAVSEIDAGQTVDVVQSFNAPYSLIGQSSVTQQVTVTYTDREGTPYTDTYTMSLNIKGYTSSGPAGPTATPTAVVRPQLVISNYSSDVAVLQPGSEFTLKVEARNLGNGNARGVTMIMGGGSSSGTVDGTPQPGGVDGGGGEFTNFAPLKSSNIQFIGDILSGEAIQAEQPLVVNVTTNPGAYSVKFSFIYTDDKGNRYTDAQVITLLVYSLPVLEVSFYQDTMGTLFVGQPSLLPIQINNISRKPAILGNMTVTGPEGVQVMNGSTLLGTIDAGGYTTLDAQVIPMQAGPLELTFTINYMDDFNQPRSIVQTKTVEVMDAPVIE
ncbi:MAG TPA: hypothetical protein VHO48_15045, partial [Anaerolineaceae bacterium]|nr:hypothetical protein [Anaerolineaceae bacterium]